MFNNTSDVRDVVCNLCENMPLSQYRFLFLAVQDTLCECFENSSKYCLY